MPKNRGKIKSSTEQEQPQGIPPETREQREFSEQEFLSEYREKATVPTALAEIRRQAEEWRARLRREFTNQRGERKITSIERELAKLILDADSLEREYYENIVSLLSRDEYLLRRKEEIGESEREAIKKREDDYKFVDRQLRIEEERLSRRQEEVGQEDAEIETGVRGMIAELIDTYREERESIVSGGGFLGEERRESLNGLGEAFEDDAMSIIERAPFTKAQVRLATEKMMKIVRRVRDLIWTGLTMGQG